MPDNGIVPKKSCSDGKYVVIFRLLYSRILMSNRCSFFALRVGQNITV